mgnify:CR=1 FL=1
MPIERVTGRPAHWLGGATTAGRLIWLGRYPGLIPARGRGDRVLGDLYVLPGTRDLHHLDRYEGCHLGRRAEYERVRQPVMTDDGPRVAWVYRYARPAGTRAGIRDGDYLDFVSAQSGRIGYPS